jgi:hypothetical protein
MSKFTISSALASLMDVPGAWGLWQAAPGDVNLWVVMISFGIGLIGARLLKLLGSKSNWLLMLNVKQRDCGKTN